MDASYEAEESLPFCACQKEPTEEELITGQCEKCDKPLLD